MEQTATRPRSPFEALGGKEVIERVVARFYDLMETDPAYRELREMHAPDLAPMRHSLAGFLTGWSGGPRDWFEENPGKCMMSAHSGMPITAETARQWVAAMRRAIGDSDIADAELGSALADTLENIALGMAPR